MKHPIRRRNWIQLALAQAAGALGCCAWAQEEVALDFNPFKLGIASGQPTSSSVVLWTRLLPANPFSNPWGNRAVTVSWELAHDDKFGRVIQQGNVSALAELAHSVHLEVLNLQADQIYYYRFRVGGMYSPVGRTRTLPDATATNTPLKLAFASCQRYHSGTFDAYDFMLADNPDLVVFLGDYIYEGGAGMGESRGKPLKPAFKLSDYRELYELARSDPSLANMHAACPWLILWDDHEVTNDYAGGEVRAGLDKGSLAKLMAMGFQAWYEHMPVSPRVLKDGVEGLLKNGTELKLYETFSWGRLADLHLLDTRQYRSRQVGCGFAGLFEPKDCTDYNNPARSMLGETQEAWLLNQLQKAGETKSGASWNLICQPLVFTRLLFPVGAGRVNQDNWDGYPVSRERILKACVEHQTKNPVIFGGDIHQNWASHVHTDPLTMQGPVVMPEFCSTSIATPSFGPLSAKEMKDLAPHCIYTDRHLRGYGLVELTASTMRVDFRVVGRNSEGSSQISSAATFTVKSGSPMISVTQATPLGK
ncbi:MAG: hypothetical protein RL392_2206 [Pseudomonadota bacterium]|jgi:alkaline phosphatase D